MDFDSLCKGGTRTVPAAWHKGTIRQHWLDKSPEKETIFKTNYQNL